MKGIAFSLAVATCFEVGSTSAIGTASSVFDASGSAAVASSSREQRPMTTRRNDGLRLCLFVEPSPFTYTSGYANRFREMLSHLERSEAAAHVITTDANVDIQDRPTEAYGFCAEFCSGFPLPKYNLTTVSFDYSLSGARSVYSFRPNMIHVSSPGFMVFSAIVCSRVFSVPLLMSYHTHLPVYLPSYFSNRFLAAILRKLAWFYIKAVHYFSDLTLVTSPQIAEEFESHGIRRVDVWHKGIDAERFHPKHRSEEFRKDVFRVQRKDDFVLLYVGRLASEKRVASLLKIMKELPSEENIRLCLVGDGPQREELKKLFESDERVLFVGELHGDELSTAYASADTFVFPSDSETLGFVIMEAMASGLPVVAARAGGIPNMVTLADTGYLVLPHVEGEASKYANYILLLKSNRKIRDPIIRNARQATEAWTWDASMKNLVENQYKQTRKNYERRWSVWLWRKLFGGGDRHSIPAVAGDKEV